MGSVTKAILRALSSCKLPNNEVGGCGGSHSQGHVHGLVGMREHTTFMFKGAGLWELRAVGTDWEALLVG